MNVTENKIETLHKRKSIKQDIEQTPSPPPSIKVKPISPDTDTTTFQLNLTGFSFFYKDLPQVPEK